MVVEDEVPGDRIDVHGLQDPGADLHVALHQLELLGGELARLGQDVVGYAGLPDVVERRVHVQPPQLGDGQPEPLSQEGGVAGDPLDVAVGVGVSLVGVVLQGGDHRRVELLDLVPQDVQLVLAVVEIRGPTDRHGQVPALPGLVDVAEEAGFVHGVGDGVHVGVAGQEYAVEAGIGLAGLPEQHVAGHAGHALVGDQHRRLPSVRGYLSQELQRVFSRVRRFHPHVGESGPQFSLEALGDDRLVVDADYVSIAHG